MMRLVYKAKWWLLQGKEGEGDEGGGGGGRGESEGRGRRKEEEKEEEEELECPICCECFNGFLNVPHVLWCGHTLCRSCLLSLPSAFFRFPSHNSIVPFFISCPWCHFLSLRLVKRGTIWFPSRNFFVMGLVDSPRACRSTETCDRHLLCDKLGKAVVQSDGQDRRTSLPIEQPLDASASLPAKITYVLLFLMIVLLLLPATAAVLIIYLLLAFFGIVPSFVVFYFAWIALYWLVNKIAA